MQPFSYFYQPAYDSHYAQAYMRSAPAAPYSNVPSTSNPSPSFPPQSPTQSFQSSPAWYRPGNCRCTYRGCTLTGSQKTIEIHMMDRHLIYPPGWKNRDGKSDWDADPSLKGKRIPIQGTGLTLDNPDDLKAWIEERRKRWPSATRVEEKKRKYEEAVASGQLDPTDSRFHRRKRQRPEEHVSRPRGQNSRGRGRTRGTDSGWNNRGRGVREQPGLPGAPAPSPPPPPPQTGNEKHVSDRGGDNDSDSAPEVVSSRRTHQESIVEADEAPRKETENDIPPKGMKLSRRMNPAQPKKGPHNPFATRPTLLRNLLLPDIRMTISNLSQAIRFLVNNDFLRDVEERPGDANDIKIQVMDVPKDSIHESE